MEKGEANLSMVESDQIRNMTLTAQNFERKHYRTALPETLPDMISLRMYEMRLKQTELSRELGVSDTKLSLIMHGKQQPDIKFIKAVRTKLNVPADFILKHIQEIFVYTLSRPKATYNSISRSSHLHITFLTKGLPQAFFTHNL